MGKNIQKRVIDITGIELMLGEPTICLGNGEQGFDCCCDECDHYLLCFPEFDLINEEKSKKKNHIYERVCIFPRLEDDFIVISIIKRKIRETP